MLSIDGVVASEAAAAGDVRRPLPTAEGGSETCGQGQRRSEGEEACLCFYHSLKVHTVRAKTMSYEALEREYIITKSATRAGLPPLPEDPKEALAWMRSGVKNDDSRATFELAQAYQYGKCGISINAINQR